MGLYDKPYDQWTEKDMARVAAARLPFALALASAGFHIAPARTGQPKCLLKGWEAAATTDPETIKKWSEDYGQFAVVAKRGHGVMLDVDEPDGLPPLGFDWAWVEGTLQVRSASGTGKHVYLPWDPVFHGLPKRATLEVFSEGGIRLLEWKLDRSQVAAPWSFRESDGKKPAGWYVPVPGRLTPGRCADPDRLAMWALAHARNAGCAREFEALPWKWHPDWDVNEFLAHYGCTLACEGQGREETEWFVVPEECPLCRRRTLVGRADNDVIGARMKFIFGGHGWGISALCCGEGRPAPELKEELLERMREEEPGFDHWKGPIFQEYGDEEMETDLKRAWALPQRPERQQQDEPAACATTHGDHDWWAEKKQELDGVRTSWRDGDDDKKYREERHIVEEEVWGCVRRALQERCDFLRDAYPYVFVRDEALLVELHDEVESLSLLGRLGLLATQPHTKLVKDNLELFVHTHGKDVEMGHWGKLEGGKIYVNNGRGGMFRVPPGDNIEEVPNGTDGVYMHDPAVLAWPSLEEMRKSTGMMRAILQAGNPEMGGYAGLRLGVEPPGGTPLCEYLNAPFEEQSLRPLQYLQLLMARWLSLFMRGASSLLPICFATGEQGSGKTTVFEKMAWLVEGFGEKAGAMPKDLRGLLAVLTNRHVAIFDNVDRTRWDEDNKLDYICKAATGGHVELAQLYQTNVPRKYTLHCDQFLTARNNVWPEGATDAGRRTLFFPLRLPAPDRIIERDKWRKDVERNRTTYLAETLVRLQGCLRGLQLTEGRSYPHRSEMHEFETLTMRLADAEGWADGMAAIWEGYMGDYKAAMVEHSPLVGALRAWAGGPAGRKAIDGGSWVGSAEIYEEVRRLLDPKDMRWNGSKSFGRAMASGMSSLRYALGARTKMLHGNRLYAFKPSREAREKARQAFEACGGRARNAIEEDDAANSLLD